MGIHNFIIISTLLTIFSEVFRYTYRVDIKLFYFVVLLNTSLLMFLNKIRINKWHIIVIFALFLMGILSIILKSNHFQNFILQLTGISFVSLYYYNFFRYQKIGLQNIYKIYCKLAFMVSLFGIAQFLYLLIIANKYVRLQSIMLEPAHFATVVLPAFFYYANNLISNGKYKFETLVILVAVLLANSSLGFIGLSLAVVFLIKKLSLLKVLAIVILLPVFFLSLYKFSSGFKLRFDDTTNVLVSKNLEGANNSTFALVANFFVAVENLKSNILFGGGLGSHVLAHNRHIASIKGSESFGRSVVLNSKDACSLFTRVLSELGFMGVIFVLYFLVKFNVSRPEVRRIISKGALIYFLLKLIREGHYFPPEMYFFVMLYVFNYLEQKSQCLLYSSKC